STQRDAVARQRAGDAGRRHPRRHPRGSLPALRARLRRRRRAGERCHSQLRWIGTVCRLSVRLRMLRDLFDDLRFGTRLIRNHPGLSAATVLTFTLGLGLDAGVFTVIDGMMFRPRVGYDPATFVEIIEDVADANGRAAALPLVSLRDYDAFAGAA